MKEKQRVEKTQKEKDAEEKEKRDREWTPAAIRNVIEVLETVPEKPVILQKGNKTVEQVEKEERRLSEKEQLRRESPYCCAKKCEEMTWHLLKDLKNQELIEEFHVVKRTNYDSLKFAKHCEMILSKIESLKEEKGS